MRAAFFLILSLLCLSSIQAQDNNLDKDNLRVFLDCNAWCDNSFIKTEINYVDFVPDRFTSNIYIMITSQRTGSGGEELILYFNGQKNFKGMDDTLKFNRSSVATEDEYRKELVQYLKVGLTRYVGKTSLVNKLTINSVIKEGEKAINSTENKKDPWNFWVMSINFSGNYSKDDYYKNFSYSTSFSANKTTEKIKVINRVYYNKNIREIAIDDDKFKFSNIGYGGTSGIVKSINSHWSIGETISYENSSFSNLDRNIEISPALEYSFFPYKDAVKKSITLYYEVGPMWIDYIDTTYYNKLNDKLFKHALSLNFGFIQKWGNVSANLEYESFLNSFKLQNEKISGKDVNNFSVSANMDLRIVKGLSFYSYFSYDITKGIYPNIRKADFNEDDILSNVRQYPTTNSFYAYFGLTYRFGSIYNNVVNPRFNSGGF